MKGKRAILIAVLSAFVLLFAGCGAAYVLVPYFVLLQGSDIHA